jgi:hypothetical protein
MAYYGTHPDPVSVLAEQYPLTLVSLRINKTRQVSERLGTILTNFLQFEFAKEVPYAFLNGPISPLKRAPGFRREFHRKRSNLVNLGQIGLEKGFPGRREHDKILLFFEQRPDLLGKGGKFFLQFIPGTEILVKKAEKFLILG